MKKALTLSIIIPAYNEERHLADCLHSIESQTVKPDEVIVVDNNSSDRTTKIAREFSFVKLIHEKEQGLIPARNHGFEVAKGNILARINADVVLNESWVETALRKFEDPDVAAITGPALTKFLPGLPTHTDIYSRGYLYMTRAYFRVGILWGANMALRHSVWDKIKKDADNEDDYVHEDQDLSVLVASIGGRSVYVPTLVVSTNEQSYFYWPKFSEYMVRRWRTKAHHRRIGSYAKPSMHRALAITSYLTIAALFIPWLLFAWASFATYFFSFRWLRR